MRKRSKICMPYGCLYLNNDGSKWITNDMEFVLIDEMNHYQKVRCAEYYESFGNFACFVFKYQGKRIKRLPESLEKINNLPVIRIK